MILLAINEVPSVQADLAFASEDTFSYGAALLSYLSFFLQIYKYIRHDSQTIILDSTWDSYSLNFTGIASKRKHVL